MPSGLIEQMSDAVNAAPNNGRLVVKIGKVLVKMQPIECAA